MRRLMLVALALVEGCSSNAPHETAPGPVTSPDLGPIPDVHIDVIGNAGLGHDEHLVQWYFARGRTKGVHCTVDEIVDECRIERCAVSGTDGKSFWPGSVTMTSPSIGTGVELVGGGLGQSRDKPDFAPDEVVHFSGAGSSALAPFELDVRVPRRTEPQSLANCIRIELTNPGDDPCVVDEASPIAKWTGGDKFVTVRFDNILEPEGKSLSCSFDAAPQKGQIPANALARLPRGVPFVVRISSSFEVVRSDDLAVLAYRYPISRIQTLQLE